MHLCKQDNKMEWRERCSDKVTRLFSFLHPSQTYTSPLNETTYPHSSPFSSLTSPPFVANITQPTHPSLPHMASPVVGHQALAQAQLAEDVHHDLHGRVVSDSEGAHVQNGAQLEGPGTVGGQRWGMLGKINPRVQQDALLLAAGVL